MKVLFVSTLYFPNAVGGAEATVKILAEELVRAGGTAVVVTIATDGKDAVRDVNGVRVHYVPSWNVFFPHRPDPRPRLLAPLFQFLDAFNLVMALRLRRIVAREAPNVVNLHNIQGFSSASWLTLKMAGVPMVQTLHDHYTACANSVMYRNGRNCTKPCIRCRIFCYPRKVLSRNVDVLTAVSERLRSRIVGFGIFARVADTRVVHGANLEEPVHEAPCSRSRSLPLKVGFLGRLEPIKGIETLIDASRDLPGDRLEVLVGGRGSPAYEQQLASYAAAAPVVFLGRVVPANFFRQIDILVVPSLVEDSLPRVVHEAFAYGVPVIGADIGGIPEMVRPGATGYLIPPDDREALRALLKRLCAEPPDWASLHAACLREAQRFSLSSIYRQYSLAWSAAAARRPRRRVNSRASR